MRLTVFGPAEEEESAMWYSVAIAEGGSLSVFVTSNKIYMVGRRITSVMVAQDARKGRRVLDRFGPSGGGNTLRPVCGCIIPVLECGGMCLATELCAL